MLQHNFYMDLFIQKQISKFIFILKFYTVYEKVTFSQFVALHSFYSFQCSFLAYPNVYVKVPEEMKESKLLRKDNLEY